MKVLVLNCGSSSIKFQLIDFPTESVVAKGVIEKIGAEDAIVNYTPGEKKKIKSIQSVKDHKQSIKIVIDLLCNKESGVLTSMSEIGACGHRVVHAGEEFSGSVLITDEVLTALKKCVPLAPLHNPANITGIEACMDLLPGVPQVGVFDTAFHQTMPAHAFLYALPYELYEKHQVRRYGFHGTSHRYVSKIASEMLNRKYQDMKIITCHLGNGASICAINKGKSVDTSMGFTPLEGLIMGTRCGDIDPALPVYIQNTLGITAKEVDTMMNKNSGVLGITGVSNDMRTIEEKAFDEKDAQCQLALDMYHYRILKYVGAYAAAMNGVDAIVFTGGIGENGWETREEVGKNLGYLGAHMDYEKNKVRGKDLVFSTPESTVQLMAVCTNEELVIARDTLEIIEEK